MESSYIVHKVDRHEIKDNNNRAHTPNKEVKLLILAEDSFENFMGRHTHGGVLLLILI